MDIINLASALIGTAAIGVADSPFPPMESPVDISNLASGLIGSAIGVASAFLIAVYQSRATAKENEKQNRILAEENEKQRLHDIRMRERQERHDKDMQRREGNIKRTGIASMREIGGG